MRAVPFLPSWAVEVLLAVDHRLEDLVLLLILLLHPTRQLHVFCCHDVAHKNVELLLGDAVLIDLLD